jgi:hypothetical protein
MRRLHAIVCSLVLIALGTAWSAGFGGTMYQSCPADCCAPTKDSHPCSKAPGEQPEGTTVASDPECSCNSTCDATCSECMYFHAGAVMQVVSLTLSSAIFAFNSPEGSLQHHPSRNFRPPPTPLA